MLPFGWLDLFLFGFYLLSTLLIIRKSWFYSFYDFTKFILLLLITFVIARYSTFLNHPFLNLSNLHFYLLVQIVLFSVLWKTINFRKSFIYLNTQTINIDQFIYFNKLNTHLNYIPSLIIAFFITFTFFTVLLSFNTSSPLLQNLIAHSLVKELPYKIYFASGGNREQSLFDSILYTSTPGIESSERDVTEQDITAQSFRAQQAMINQEREKEGLPIIYPSPYPSVISIVEVPASPFPTSTAVASPTIVDTPQPSSEPNPSPSLPSPKSSPISQPSPKMASSPKATPKPEPTAQSVNTQDVEQEVLRLINQERRKEGIPDLSWDNNIAVVARSHSLDMNNRNFFSHETPDGISPFQRMKIGGIEYKNAAENIVGTQTAELMVKRWMNSEGHKKNILNPVYTKTGIGIVQNKKYGLLGTQNFAN